MNIENIIDYKDYILESLNILDVVQYLNIDLIENFSGSFTHKAICPFSFHKGGNENTASFRLDSKNNKYWCYGCNSGGNTANLIQLMIGCPYQEGLRKIAILSGLLDGDDLTFNIDPVNAAPPKINNIDIHFQCSVAIRKHLEVFKNTPFYETEVKWIDEAIEKLDNLFDSIDIYDVERAQKAKDKLLVILSNRKQYR